MSNEEILRKSIEKAQKNGWEVEELNGRREKDYEALCEVLCDRKMYHSIIFSHDFAKAFFGEGEAYAYCGEKSCSRNLLGPKDWQYHLQQMVLREEPLQYLKKFINI